MELLQSITTRPVLVSPQGRFSRSILMLRSRPQIIVGTPGRVLDLANRRVLFVPEDDCIALFIVQLRILSSKDDKDPDIHCVFYNASGRTIHPCRRFSCVVLACVAVSLPKLTLTALDIGYGTSCVVALRLFCCRWCDPRQLAVLEAALS